METEELKKYIEEFFTEKESKRKVVIHTGTGGMAHIKSALDDMFYQTTTKINDSIKEKELEDARRIIYTD